MARTTVVKEARPDSKSSITRNFSVAEIKAIVSKKSHATTILCDVLAIEIIQCQIERTFPHLNKLFETKMNISKPLNIARKRSFFNVAGFLNLPLDCDEFT